MIQIPPLHTIGNVSLAVGALFLLRYFLAMRRLWKEAGHRPDFQFGDYFRATKKGAFGMQLEAQRAYAARQLVLGLVLGLLGLGIYAWLFAMALTGGIA